MSRWTKKQVEGLIGSINGRWKRDLKHKEKLRIDRSECTLCKHYALSACKGCPVYIVTGSIGCCSFQEYKDYLLDISPENATKVRLALIRMHNLGVSKKNQIPENKSKRIK